MVIIFQKTEEVRSLLEYMSNVPEDTEYNEYIKEKIRERTCENKCPFSFDRSFNDENGSNKAPGGVNGGWNYDRKLIAKAHVAFDDGFGRNIVQYITNNTPGKGSVTPVTVGDIGAGVGQLGAWLRDNKVNNVSWFGWDGGSNVETFAGQKVDLVHTKNYLVPKVCWLDASSPLHLYLTQMCSAPYDWVTSVEVGEHIPAERMDTFVDNLVMMARYGVILTWAVKGQGGSWHVNELNNDEVIKIMAGRDMEYQEEISMIMRKQVCCLGWLRKTIMVFKKKS